MFNTTGDNINALNDTDLRTLVGLLCEADLHLQKIPTAGVTYGGSQTAKDGGLDVCVNLICPVNPDGFIPRSITGYQVKKSDMPRAKINEEMRPNGVLRPVICELTNANGAYIIVSAASTADSALKNRKQAMSDALSNITNAPNLKLDFYDRNRVASWVNCHPSLVLWVKGKIGRSIQGWRPFGNWANPKAEPDEDYLLDDGIRLHNGINKNPEGMNAVNGINALRAALASPAVSVRLAGLSGVGKTRLLQALFDSRIGVAPLPDSQVCYTDMSDSPHPAPVAFAEQLRALNKKATLIIDNCPPELHKSLTAVCTAFGSLVSLITVEYDVREDQPEETEVFRLEPALIELVEKIIHIRFKHLSQTDARTIAKFSEGNARVAIALANTVNQGETIATLKDEDLFKRLFHQRHNPNDNLLKSAEVCALVYSFDAETLADTDSELKLLASLAEITVNALHKDVAELKRRDLVQQRSIWRAVLPHALANRLAKQALENIPLDCVLSIFEKKENNRLLKSFSRRLSYLHDSEQAIRIAQRWLSPQGLLGDINGINYLGTDYLGISLLKNIAPVAPIATLEAIERAANGVHGQQFTSRNNSYFMEITRLLRSLAYEAELFERCTIILCRFALSEKPKENNNSIRDLLKSLFFLYLSGTHALAEQRLKVIEQLTQSDAEQEQELGLSLLGCALEAWDFTSLYGFHFGARSRDYGYSPETEEEIQQWFAVFIDFATTLIISEQPTTNQVKALLAEKFRGLWTRGGVFDALETTANAIIAKAAWHEGWIAVKTTIKFDADQMYPDLLSRLQTLEKLLKPRNLLEQARAYAFSDANGSDSLFDADENDGYEQLEKIRQQIGREVAVNEAIFNELLPELVTLDISGAGLCSFATGLAKGCEDPLAMWEKFRNQLSTVAINQRKDTVLYCFLHTISQTHPEIAAQILNEAVSDEILAIMFPYLQTAVEIDAQGIRRLKQSLENNIAPAWAYRGLFFLQNHKNINDADLSDLLRMLAFKPDGLIVAIKCLIIRLRFIEEENYVCSEIIISFGQELMTQIDFEHNRQIDYDLGIIAKACLVGETGITTTKIICDKFIKASSKYTFRSSNYPRFLANLAKQQPQVFLDSFFNEIRCSSFNAVYLFTNRDSPKLLSQIAGQVILDWCNVNPAIRYPKIAACMVAYQHNEQKNGLEWTPLSLDVINKAPDIATVLNAFKNNFRPTSWSGSRASIMEKRLALITQLKTHENPVISTWAHNQEKEFAEEIRQERQWENERNRKQDERFE